MELAKIYIKSQDFDLNYNILEALAKGSGWNNLYEPYKFEIKTLPSSIENIIRAYKFMLIELTLYHKTHPDCQKTLDAIRRTKEELKKAIEYKKGEQNVEI